MRPFALAILTCALALVVAPRAQQPVVPLWQETFESGAPPWKFSGRYDENLGTCGGRVPSNGRPVLWEEEVLPTGGFRGSRGVRIRVCANQQQENVGWWLNGNRVKPTWAVGDLRVLRFRIRFHETFRWDGNSSFQNKLAEWGFSPDRVILTNERGHQSSYCNQQQNLSTEYGLLQIKTGINPPCTPPVRITHSVWYSVQMAVQTGPQGSYRLWVNNNDMSRPDSQISGFSRGVNAWNDSMPIGGFWTHARATASIIDYDDITYDDKLDPAWHPAAPPPPPPPIDCAGTWGAWTRIAGSETACVNGTRTFREQAFFTVVTPPANGGEACPASPDTRTAAEACTMPPPPPPVLGLTATGSTRTCTLVATAQPPDSATGWGVQFSRRLAGADAWVNHGTRDTAAPYTRSAAVALGQWEVRAVWSRTGATPVTVGTLAVWSCEP